jgi:hypothetical protein
MQRKVPYLAERAGGIADSSRIGRHVEDELIGGGDSSGEGVNGADPNGGVAEPGGMGIAAAASEQSKGSATGEFIDLSEQRHQEDGTGALLACGRRAATFHCRAALRQSRW